MKTKPQEVNDLSGASLKKKKTKKRRRNTGTPSNTSNKRHSADTGLLSLGKLTEEPIMKRYTQDPNQVKPTLSRGIRSLKFMSRKKETIDSVPIKEIKETSLPEKWVAQVSPTKVLPKKKLLIRKTNVSALKMQLQQSRKSFGSYNSVIESLKDPNYDEDAIDDQEMADHYTKMRG